MNNHKDEWFQLGPDACARMSTLYFERNIPDDTAESLKNTINNLDMILEKLGKDKTSPHYDNEMSLRKAILNLRSYIYDSASRIERITQICEDITFDLDDVCREGAFNYFFLVKYRDLELRA